MAFDVWQEVKLDQIAKIRKGQQKSKSTLTNEGDYPVINGGVRPSGYTDEWNTEAGTITISEGGNSCGFVSLVNQRFWSGGHCYTLENLQVCRDFLFYSLKLLEPKIMRLRTGSGLPNIQKSELSKFSIFLPPPHQQSKIARLLSTWDQAIETAQALLDRTS